MLSYFDIQIRKSFSGRFSWFLASKIDSEPWKFPIFEGSHLSCLTRYHKILWGCLFGCKNLLNSTWNILKFHNRCYASQWASISVTTLPAKLEGLNFISNTVHSITFIWNKFKKIAAGSEFLHYSIRFVEVNGLLNQVSILLIHYKHR